MAVAYDTIVIGGGPGGASAATYLARAGRRVLVLEKEHFPRFHIGESLLPYNRRLFAEMGVLPALAAAGFPVKVGAQFHLGNGSKFTRFRFSESPFTREHQTFQVERARFDQILLDHARRCGAEAREGWTGQRVTHAPDHVTVEARDSSGDVATFRAPFVIDASGRANVTGNQEGLRVSHPTLRKLAIYGHFTGVRRDPVQQGNDTVIVRLKDAWFWSIPLSAEKTSVGCVLDQAAYAAAAGSADDVFQRHVQSSQTMREWMALAQPVGPLQTTSDFSYHNRRFTSRRLLRVGDAAGFMDPIFSAGVYLAMYSGKLAAQAVLESLARGDDGAGRFKAYEKRVRAAMHTYWRMVHHFYTTPFIELLMEPRHRLQIPAAVNAVLAGELEGGWALRWRMRAFFWLVKAQARWPLVPRISFKEPEHVEAEAVQRVDAPA